MSDSSRFSRRFLLKAGTAAAALIVLSSGAVRLLVYNTKEDDADALASWVEITTDNRVHILFPSTEMGQGSETALPQILADELDADWEQVVIHQLNTDDRRFGNPAFGHVLYTAGSSGVYAYFNVMREAGAHLRDMMRQRVATEWGVDIGSVKTSNSSATHASSGRSMRYGDIISLPDFASTNPSKPPALKSPADYTLIGKSIPRRDIPAKVTGKAVFAIDVRVPDMLYATVLRSPVEGESIESIDDQAALATKDVLEVITLPDGVAVVAKTLHASLTGRAKLQVTWTEDSLFRRHSSSDTLEAYKEVAQSQVAGEPWRTAGNVDASLERAGKIIDAVYTSDYAYHGQLEPMAAVANVDEDGKGAEIWAGTQTQSWTTRTATEVLQTTKERIKLNMMTMGGGFGRRTELMQNYVRDALLCSRSVKKPVKVIWTREDDVKFGAFRPAAAQYLRAGLNEKGALAAFHHRVATPSVIKYFNPVRWQQVVPKDVISMRGAENKFYKIDNFLAEHVITERHARILPWRGIGAAYTSFAAEAFMDEIAFMAGADPIKFRRSLLSENPRGVALIDKVTGMAASVPLEEGRGRGIAFAGYGNTQSAGIVEISVNERTGDIRVHNAWVAVDAGQVISPNNAQNQIEGGVLWGVSASLYECITITNGQVDQSNFYDYLVLRNHLAPKIDVHIMQNNEKPTQVGEAGNPLVAPAIANAFFVVTGRRLRHLPFTADRVREALS